MYGLADFISLCEGASRHSSSYSKYMATLDCMDVGHPILRRLNNESSFIRSCIVGTGILVFIFSLAIPVFDDLLTLISALCGTPLSVYVSLIPEPPQPADSLVRSPPLCGSGRHDELDRHLSEDLNGGSAVPSVSSSLPSRCLSQSRERYQLSYP